LSFEHDFPDAQVIVLEQNYRSTKNILETASNIISVNEKRKPVQLWTENRVGEKVNNCRRLTTKQEEAQYVLREIEQLVARGKSITVI